MKPMRESDLVRCAQSGDEAAFRQLVELYAALTERTARALLVDRTQAEDAVQEAWLDAWRALSHFDPSRPFRPWILTFTANRCRMLARKKAPFTVPYRDHMSGDQDGLVTEVTQAYIVGQARDEELERALALLDDSRRQVVTLRFYADLSLEEIADVTGTPLGTVKSRLHRALEKLREWLTGSYRIPDPEKEVTP